MKTIHYVVTDNEGLHARPAGLLVKEANKFNSNISIQKGEKSADAKRIFSIMSMAVKKGEEITLTFEGEDEETAANTLEQFLQENL